MIVPVGTYCTYTKVRYEYSCTGNLAKKYGKAKTLDAQNRRCALWTLGLHRRFLCIRGYFLDAKTADARYTCTST